MMRVQAGRPIADVVAEAGIAHAAMSKWIARYRQSGAPELEDRSSAPPRPVPRLWTSSSTDTRNPLAGQSQPELPTRHPTPPGRPTGPANPSWPASTGRIVHLDVKKVGRIPPRGGWRAHGRARPRGQGLQAGQKSQNRLHLPAHRHRRLLPPGLHRGPG